MNSKKVYLAVDLGAESGRVLAGEFDGHQLVLNVVHSFPMALSTSMAPFTGIQLACMSKS